MFMILIVIALPILLTLKAINFKHIQQSFRFVDCLRSLMRFQSLKYYVNYSRRERRHVKWDNFLNVLILANILLLMVAFMNAI